jgi:catechol 2,3-dioxygenase-like lactoylglutathione lyase family enzyme
MKSQVGHILINIDPKNIPFYKELFDFLGWSVIRQDENKIGLADEHGAGVWFCNGLKKISNDYDGIGMNHLAVAVHTQSDVDKAADYLKAHGVQALFETPRHRPEFCHNPDMTYYQVMFASPDNLLLEVVYKGTIDK